MRHSDIRRFPITTGIGIDNSSEAISIHRKGETGLVQRAEKARVALKRKSEPQYLQASFFKKNCCCCSLSQEKNINNINSSFLGSTSNQRIAMNGDSYSSRGMAPSTTKSAKRNESATNLQESTDAGRHGSSREHYVRWSS